jgi:hypothetical protein
MARLLHREQLDVAALTRGRLQGGFEGPAGTTEPQTVTSPLRHMSGSMTGAA